jgi:hypothetical protein
MPKLAEFEGGRLNVKQETESSETQAGSYEILQCSRDDAASLFPTDSLTAVHNSTNLFNEHIIKTVNIRAGKANFSRLVDEAAAAEEIMIARSGKPVARLVFPVVSGDASKVAAPRPCGCGRLDIGAR